MRTIKKIVNFYVDGFKSMTWGKQLWMLIFLKLFLIFFIMKFFFFSDTIEDKYQTEEEVSSSFIVAGCHWCQPFGLMDIGCQCLDAKSGWNCF
jgi:uncharacterized membrane protein